MKYTAEEKEDFFISEMNSLKNRQTEIYEELLRINRNIEELIDAVLEN